MIRTWREISIYDEPEEYLDMVLRPVYEFRGTTGPYQFCHHYGIEIPQWVMDCKKRFKKRFKKGQRAFSPYDCMKVAEAKVAEAKLSIVNKL